MLSYVTYVGHVTHVTLPTTNLLQRYKVYEF